MKMVYRLILISVFCAVAAAGGWFYAQHRNDNAHEAISREGVLMQIKQMNRLESTAFYIDTIIRTEKKGDWRRLWQGSQSGVFFVRQHHGKSDHSLGQTPSLSQLLWAAAVD